jgi:hypothetical protein
MTKPRNDIPLAFVAFALFVLTSVAHAEPVKGGTTVPCSVVATNIAKDDSWTAARKYAVMLVIATHPQLKCNLDTIDTFRIFLDTGKWSYKLDTLDGQLIVPGKLTSAAHAKSPAEYAAQSFAYVVHGASVCGHPEWTDRAEVKAVLSTVLSGDPSPAQLGEATAIGFGGFDLAVKLNGKATACQKLDAASILPMTT